MSFVMEASLRDNRCNVTENEICNKHANKYLKHMHI